MYITKSCCQVPAVVSNYSPVGTMENLGDLPVYAVGDKSSKKAVLVIYDAFALHPNTKQFCDVLAKQCGYLVVMPDWFRGNSITEDMLGDLEGVRAWLSKVGTYEVLAPSIQRVKEYLVSTGIEKTGIVGFCWGAKIAIELSGKDSYYSAASLIHPSMFTLEDADAAQAPLLLIPAQNDPDFTEFMERLSRYPFGDKCKHVRFDDVQHGFAAALGNWEEGSLDKERATEAIQLTLDFFAEHVNV
ncbi:Alpha/Beta hydrolase protein [Umbelopsis sp. PMI_123]|nr:Alpha/Beta hydrolase protein [Umbelopsis sp. PMI_123]